MTPDPPPPRRGRRDNGLPAASFVPLADVDPRVGDHLLDLLKLAGVPAYLEPSSDVEPYTRAVALPSPPTDRLWVDRERHGAARAILEAEARTSGAPPHPSQGGQRPAARGDLDSRPSAGLTDVDEERAWEEIVASWDLAVDLPVPPWPVEEDDDGPSGGAGSGTGAGPTATADPTGRAGGGTIPGPPGTTRSRPAQPPRPDPSWPPASGHLGSGTGGSDRSGGDLAGGDLSGADPTGSPPSGDGRAADPTDDEEHYVPPPPPPIPRPSRQTMLGILLLLLGIGLLAAPGVAGLDNSSGFTLGMLSLLGGATVLVLRLRDSRSDDDPDDGAVV